MPPVHSEWPLVRLLWCMHLTPSSRPELHMARACQQCRCMTLILQSLACNLKGTWTRGTVAVCEMDWASTFSMLRQKTYVQETPKSSEQSSFHSTSTKTTYFGRILDATCDAPTLIGTEIKCRPNHCLQYLLFLLPPSVMKSNLKPSLEKGRNIALSPCSSHGSVLAPPK